MLVVVPMTNAATPNTPIKVFFTTITVLLAPVLCFKKTNVSIKAGNANPSVVKHSAPNNEINKSNLGIATASKTIKRKITVSITK